MASNYAAIVQGLKAAIETGVPDLRNVYAYEPRTLSDRLFYFVLADFEILPPAMDSMEIKWRWGGRLVVEYLSNDKAEEIITLLVPQIIAAVFGDLSAGGALPDGQITIEAGQGKYPVSNQVKFRAVDFLITAIERIAFEYAL